MAFCGLFEALFVLAAVSALFGADRTLAVPLTLGAVAFAAMTWVGWMTQVRLQARGSAGISWDEARGALVVDGQHLVTVVYLAGVAALALFALLGVVVSGWSALDGAGADALVVFTICVALLAGLVIGGAQMWRWGTPRLLVSTDGLRHRARGTEAGLAWRDIHGISLTNVTGRDYSITAIGPSSAQDVTVVGQTLAADPALVAHLLAFYWSHDDARAELGSEASLHRARSGGFAV
jgi:hypothetical protein